MKWEWNDKFCEEGCHNYRRVTENPGLNLRFVQLLLLLMMMIGQII
jgi:hypothetical protein